MDYQGYRPLSQEPESISYTATILSGNTSIVVSHGLPFTPVISDFSQPIPSESPTSDPGNFWISNITSTQFTINCRNDPGVSNLSLGGRIWRR